MYYAMSGWSQSKTSAVRQNGNLPISDHFECSAYPLWESGRDVMYVHKHSKSSLDKGRNNPKGNKNTNECTLTKPATASNWRNQKSSKKNPVYLKQTPNENLIKRLHKATAAKLNIAETIRGNKSRKKSTAILIPLCVELNNYFYLPCSTRRLWIELLRFALLWFW